MEWLQEHSAAIQAVATVVLVLVTGAYVLFTKSLADRAKEQAEAAKAQADAARKGLDQAVENGLRQQAQLVQRQTVLAARAELVGLLTKTVEWVVRAKRAVFWAARVNESSARRPADVHMRWLQALRSEAEDVDASQKDCDLGYLDDFVGAFPLSKELTERLQMEARRTTMRFSDLRIDLENRIEGVARSPQILPHSARLLDDAAERLMSVLPALRGAVRSTGYARTFGAMPLDCVELGSDRFPLVVRDEEWAWDIQKESAE
jgi:hypothetical protein